MLIKLHRTCIVIWFFDLVGSDGFVLHQLTCNADRELSNNKTELQLTVW